ncbi:oncoprotein-induced transcript 3 protein-like [Lingula anatina]|uniref:Oncoprotein-induced transcript 3 protein-like n=1 Tax=Lingula anatina TaxID=7574 RepID=A0A1S3JZC3_LINAN|nr:oncoprotein-induced transcript 3 protein-like [Lingula anatina]|eukprot:XP_013415745.1 oncoprotein-induced transcript 3 protein-like [Lingula anatina]
MQKTFIQKRSMFLDLRIRLTKQSIIFLLDALAECLENASFMSYNNETGFPGATTSSASMGDIITATTETSVWWPVDDPCSNYTVLDQPWRNVANGKNYAHKCDDEYDGFVKQWYRLIGGAGTGIPSTCQATNHCGAYVPIYLNGDLPNATGAVVTIPLCGTHVNGCCDPDWPTYNIPHSLRAKHCGGYFVYELEPTTGCYAAYCGTDL